MIFLATTFLAGAFAIGLAVVTIIGLAVPLATSFLPRYFELSNARIGMKMIFKNNIPSPYVQCFQNLSAILNTLIIMSTTNTGGMIIHKKFRPDRPPSLNIRYRL